jgi:hypothetical protein
MNAHRGSAEPRCGGERSHSWISANARGRQGPSGVHVDGFRFDLAAALARGFHDVDRLAAFFDLMNQDPIVSQVKLIAEPCDVGDSGYQVGGFPPLWTE